MKSYYLVAAIAAAITSLNLATVRAGEPASEEVASSFSGSLSLDLNAHHMSYGRDIWTAGSGFNDLQVQPSLGLAWDLGNDLTISLGVWAEINDNAVSPINGDNVQEIDAWVGISYGGGPVDVSLTYQEWMYLETSERIIDIGIGPFDLPLNPSIKVHTRIDEGGAAPHDTGAVTVLGGDLPGFSLGDLDFSVPVSVAYASDGYHGGDSGFAYASVGIGTSIALSGPWSLNAGLTYYHTNSDVIPGNPDEGILTGGIGIGMSF